jgi:hypothetical protein
MLSVANTAGSVPHISPLLRKVRLLGFPTPDALLLLAVKRGCSHYAPADYDGAAVMDPGTDVLSNEELAIALLSGAQEYHPQRIRCAAQLLGNPEMDRSSLVRLALMERATPVLRYIADQAAIYDTGRRDFWKKLIAALPVAAKGRPGVWPHPSRFVSAPGRLRGGVVARPVWLRPGRMRHAAR